MISLKKALLGVAALAVMGLGTSSARADEVFQTLSGSTGTNVVCDPSGNHHILLQWIGCGFWHRVGVIEEGDSYEVGFGDGTGGFTIWVRGTSYTALSGSCSINSVCGGNGCGEAAGSIDLTVLGWSGGANFSGEAIAIKDTTKSVVVYNGYSGGTYTLTSIGYLPYC